MTDRNQSNGKIAVASAFAHLNPQQALAEGITGGFTRIGMKGKVWTLNHQGQLYRFIREDDGSPLPYLDVVFVGINPATSKLYYPPGSYSEDTSGNAPTCASLKGDVPDPGVPIPQSQYCHSCKHNEWLPNKGGKECQDHKRAAVILLPYMKTRPAMDAPFIEPVFLKIPPASLRSLKSYSDSLAHRGAHFASVITRISFAPDRQFQLNFELRQALTNAEAPLVLPFLDDPQTRFLTGTMPEINEGPPVLPEHRATPEPQETGLAQAFGAGQAAHPTAQDVTPPPKRTRKKPAEAAAPAAAMPVDKAAPWNESDDELDNEMKELMNRTVSKMLT
jgi:hypothetical protein